MPHLSKDLQFKKPTIYPSPSNFEVRRFDKLNHPHECSQLYTVYQVPKFILNSFRGVLEQRSCLQSKIMLTFIPPQGGFCERSSHFGTHQNCPRLDQPLGPAPVIVVVVLFYHAYLLVEAGFGKYAPELSCHSKILSSGGKKNALWLLPARNARGKKRVYASHSCNVEGVSFRTYSTEVVLGPEVSTQGTC